ncbi:hypothetical protein N2152v2_000913 [Parachlorella kessleri]
MLQRQEGRSHPITLSLCVILLGILGQAKADTVSRVVVNATAISQAVSSCQQDIEQIVGDVCKGRTTGDLAVTASAQAVAKATASAWAGVTIDITTDTGGKACATANATATGLAVAIANATARAIINAACCPDALAIATGASNAIAKNSSSATAQVIAEACAENGSTAQISADSVATAVSEASAAAFAQVFTSIQGCANASPCPSGGACSGGSPTPTPSSPAPVPSSPTPDVKTVPFPSPSPQSPSPSPHPSPYPQGSPVPSLSPSPDGCHACGNGGSSSSKQCTYVIVWGDTLTLIAKQFGLTVDQLLAYNPQILDPNVIFAGDEVNLCDDKQSGSSPGPSGSGGYASGSTTCTYKIRAGDTLAGLSAVYNCSVNDLLDLNPGIVPTNLQIGQAVAIPCDSKGQPRRSLKSSSRGRRTLEV